MDNRGNNGSNSKVSKAGAANVLLNHGAQLSTGSVPEPSRPVGVARVLQRVKEPMFPYPEVSSCKYPGLVEYSGDCFGTSLPHGTREA